MPSVVSPQRSLAVRPVSLIAVTLFVLNMLPAGARSDEPQTRPTTQPASAPASQPASGPSHPEADAKARELIDAAMKKYRAAKTYQDKLDARVEVVATDKDGQDAGQDERYSASLLFGRAAHIALATDNFAIHCDGKRIWLYSGRLGQYTEGEAPEHLDLDELTEELMVDDPPHPVLLVLTEPDDEFSELFPMVREFTAVERAEQDGQPGTRVTGLLDAAETPLEIEGEVIPFHLWFDEKTGLLRQLRIDFTGALRKALAEADEERDPEDKDAELPGGARKVERAVVTLDLHDVKYDADIPAEHYAFKPDKDAEKVKEFDWDKLMEMPDPEELVGRAAPVLAGTALDEKPISLEALRGRVVLLDFWATWCIPCVKAMPEMQKLAEKYAEKPVTVIGVNQDARGMDAKVKKFLAEKKVTFRQFLDIGGKLGRQYKVGAIPCTFLIDGKGVVQAVRVGAVPKLLDELSEQVDKLLKGETLFDPEKISQPGKEKPAETAPRKE
jgi:thiol-disulfide isomerase/thioredoxin